MSRMYNSDKIRFKLVFYKVATFLLLCILLGGFMSVTKLQEQANELTNEVTKVTKALNNRVSDLDELSYRLDVLESTVDELNDTRDWQTTMIYIDMEDADQELRSEIELLRQEIQE